MNKIDQIQNPNINDGAQINLDVYCLCSTARVDSFHFEDIHSSVAQNAFPLYTYYISFMSVFIPF